jgi:hypothetical protein
LRLKISAEKQEFKILSMLKILLISQPYVKMEMELVLSLKLVLTPTWEKSQILLNLLKEKQQHCNMK